VGGLAILDTPLDQTMAIARTQHATIEVVIIADAAVVVGIRIRQGKNRTEESRVVS
jgi:hypothetical protein